MNIGISEFRKVKKIARKTSCKVKIERKRGIPFILNKYKKRKIFLIALILIAIFIVFISKFIWNIEVVGNENIESETILDSLEECGLKVGEYKNNIDTKKIINELRLKREDLAWVGISIKGTNAIVNIAEAHKKPDIVNENEYCNIVACKDGIIEKISAKNGTIQVEQGEVVKKGTILIGGWIEGKYTGVRYVHSSGETIARVCYSQKEKINLKNTIKEKTGNVETKFGISINNFQINFYKRLSKFENYDTMYTRTKVKIFSDFYIPVELIKYNNYETKKKEVIYTVEEAKEKAKQVANEKLFKQIQNKEDIKNVTVNYSEYQDYVEAEVIYEVLENIGIEEKIVF